MDGLNYNKTESLVLNVAKPIAENLGFFVYDIDFLKEGGAWFLRIYIDKNGDSPISVDECEMFSRAFSEVFDKDDPIKQNYYLEVSSPGIERKIKRAEHFDLNQDCLCDIKLYKPFDGKKELVLYLDSLKNSDVLFYAEDDFDNKITIPMSQIISINLHFDF